MLVFEIEDDKKDFRFLLPKMIQFLDSRLSGPIYSTF